MKKSINNSYIEEIQGKIEYEIEKQRNRLVSHSVNTEDIPLSEKIEYKNIINYKDINIQIKNIYEYSDFSKYHDINFIVNLYTAILRREVDTQGLNHYLSLLRSGKRSKTEIISLIRYSKEGKLRGVKILGSKKRYLYTLLVSLPFIGYMFKLMILLVRLPKIQQRLNICENYISQEAEHSYKNEIILEKEINNTNSEIHDIRSILHVIKDNI